MRYRTSVYARQRPEFRGQVFRDSFSVFYVIDERRFRAQRARNMSRSRRSSRRSEEPTRRIEEAEAAEHGGDDIGRVSAGIYFVL